MAYTREQEKHFNLMQKILKTMPYYVNEYVDDKLMKLSPSTLLAYLRVYEHFFNWLRTKEIVPEGSNIDFPIEALENLKKKQVNGYIRYLSTQTKNETDAINQKIAALKALFRYLTTETENDDGECYFYRNVMSKIELVPRKESIGRKSVNMADKILHEDDGTYLLQFIESEYINYVKGTKKERYFKRDKERDLAIISLLLATGMRVSEIASLETNDIDFHNRFLNIIRKGSKEEVITFKKFALPYLRAYRDVRASRYKATELEKAFFITLHRGKSQPMSIRTIQKLMDKYTSICFEKTYSPHKLRHTYATQLAESGVAPHLIQTQLGHSSLGTTSIYMNSTLKELQKAIDEE